MTNTLERNEEQTLEEKNFLGFWTYLMTDCILFAALFATFVVLRNNTFGGPPGGELFSLPFVLIETIILLTSSFTCGLGLLAARQAHKSRVVGLFAITFVLGLAFIGMELYEFGRLAAEGNTWQRSGFLSAFFTLVGTHGLHITAGLMWISVLIARIWRFGLTPHNLRNLALLSLFWHFLDVVWIFIFSIVYLLGAVQ